ncbi:MAG: PhzF family phenazine biosynthesis isomerase, partial [Rhodospirillaceae bacterium]
YMIRIFPRTDAGGNPAPICLDADGMSAEAMRQVAADHGHESGFVLTPEAGGADHRFRYFVPNHEMEMCGHATIGALWVLRETGRIGAGPRVIDTLRGPVRARVPAAGPIATEQTVREVTPLADDYAALVLETLRLDPDALAAPTLLNAATSRIKTLVPVASRAVLDGLAPDFARIEAVCERIGSTGLYPFAPAVGDRRRFRRRR